MISLREFREQRRVRHAQAERERREDQEFLGRIVNDCFPSERACTRELGPCEQVFPCRKIIVRGEVLDRDGRRVREVSLRGATIRELREAGAVAVVSPEGYSRYGWLRDAAVLHFYRQSPGPEADRWREEQAAKLELKRREEQRQEDLQQSLSKLHRFPGLLDAYVSLYGPAEHIPMDGPEKGIKIVENLSGRPHYAVFIPVATSEEAVAFSQREGLIGIVEAHVSRDGGSFIYYGLPIRRPKDCAQHTCPVDRDMTEGL
jgi:hypothetical protein